MTEQRAMLQKQHACIMQLIRITDSQVEECLAKFINAYVRQFKPNLVDCDRSWFVRTPVFEKNILRTIEENPGTSYRRIALQERSSHHTMWNILHNQLFLSCPACSDFLVDLQLITDHFLSMASSSMQSRFTLFMQYFVYWWGILH